MSFETKLKFLNVIIQQMKINIYFESNLTKKKKKDSD